DSDENEWDLEDLPRDISPGIQQLKFPSRGRNDLCNGLLIGEETVLEATGVLQTFIHHFRVARVDLEVYDGLTFEDLPVFARICLILEILGPAPATEGPPEPDGTKPPAEQPVDVSGYPESYSPRHTGESESAKGKPKRQSW
ncbi:hypothetical protein EG327_010295, partial [Venturia inaequalis]